MYYAELFRDPSLTEQRLIELGRQNLERLIREVRHAEKATVDAKPGWTEQLLGILQAKPSNAAHFAIDFTALRHTTPFLPGEQRSLDSIGHAYGHTDFETCGSCQHRSGSTCSLLSDLPENSVGYGTPCQLSDDNIKRRALEALEKQVAAQGETKEGRLRKIKTMIDRLLAAKRQSKSQPLLPYFRGERYYRFGDRVLIWTGFPVFGENAHRWAPGTVLRAYEQRFDEIAVVLDQPLLPADAHAHKGAIQLGWARHMWYARSNTPLVLQQSDLRSLATFPSENLLRQLWVREANDQSVNDPRLYGKYMPVDVKKFEASLDTSLVLPSAEAGRRLMSGAEAASVFGFKRGQWPTSPEDVVARYEALKKTGSAPRNAEQARSTLLLRFYESRQLGGD